MTLLAFGPAADSTEIVAIDLSDDGHVQITIELELGEQVIVLPPSSISEELRSLLPTARETAA